MSWAATRARGNPKKTKEISPLGVSSTKAAYVVHRWRPVLHRSAARLWSQRTVTTSPTSGAPAADTSVSMARQTSREAPSALSMGVVVATPSWARSTMRQRSSRRSTESLDGPDPETSPRPGLLLERLGRLQHQVGPRAPRIGVDAELAPAPLERGGTDQGHRPVVEVGDVRLGQHADGIPERRDSSASRSSSPTTHVDPFRRTSTRPSADVPAAYEKTWSRRRNRRLSFPEESLPSPSTTAYRRSPTRPRASSSTCSRLSPPIDLTGYRRMAATVMLTSATLGRRRPWK